MAAWDRASRVGFSMSALAVGSGLGSIQPSAAEYNMTWVLVRIAPAMGGSAAANATVGYRYFRAGNSGSGAAALQDDQDPGLFYGELLRVSFQSQSD